jgi:hypothetical protein
MPNALFWNIVLLLVIYVAVDHAVRLTIIAVREKQVEKTTAKLKAEMKQSLASLLSNLESASKGDKGDVQNN